MSRKCMIVSESTLYEWVNRYDSIGKPLTVDEKEILMSVLYIESEQRGGLVAQVLERRKLKPEKAR